MSSKRLIGSVGDGGRRERPPARGLLGQSARWGLLGLIVLTLAGCGLGPGATPSAIHLTVTEDFGAKPVGGQGSPKVRGQETILSLLMRNSKVTTRFGGGFVQSIDGHAGTTQGGEPADWFYYVNGIEASKGGASTQVYAGDHIWWDLHDWSQTEDVPAVVGSFPEPFLNGSEGKRLPVRVECAEVSGQACETVVARLRAEDVPAAIAAIGPGDEPETLRVLVGPWPTVRATPASEAIERGPSASGVYARFAGDGKSLSLLDASGNTTKTLTSGAGLVAATRYAQEEPLWVVTGTDANGVEKAADAFSEAALHNHFALALEANGTPRPLPTR
jgi:Domain of unknown function (DUF4430)